MATTVGLTFEPPAPKPVAKAAPRDATRAELAARLAELGVDAPPKATKAQLRDLLTTAEAG